MSFKKLLALLLALAMLVCCFAACGSSDDEDEDEDEKVEDKADDEEEDEDEDADKDEEDEDADKDEDEDKDKDADEDEEDEDDKPSSNSSDIEGKWVVRIPFMEILEESGAEGLDFDAIDCDAEAYISFEFDEEMVILTIDMADCVEDFCDAYIDYLEDGGIEDLVEAQGYTMDEFEEALEDEGMTMDDFYDQLASTMETNIEGVDMSAVESEDYTFDGETVEFGDGESGMEVEIDGDEMEIIDIFGSDSDALEIILVGRVFDKK